MENPPPPSRHAGSRIITKGPNFVRSVAEIRTKSATDRTKVRREDIAFTVAAPAGGVACTSGTMTTTHVTKMSRSGYALFIDLAAGTGSSSVVEAQVWVPDLAVFGTPVASAAGGTDRDIRISLTFPDSWVVGVAYRVYVMARRASGGDSTTMRVLRAWQR